MICMYRIDKYLVSEGATMSYTCCILNIDREPEELWQEVEAIVKDEAKNNIPKARKSQRRVKLMAN